ncbi:helicase-like protein [Trypanosoma cruzi]|nr:helicase-like protein [Trypanosoma cruzi]
MALVHFTAFEWSDIGARFSELVRQHGTSKVQIRFIDETGDVGGVVNCGHLNDRLTLDFGIYHQTLGDSTLTGHLANPRAPQVPNCKTQVILSVMRAARELGHQQRLLIIAERERLSNDYAYAAVDVQNRSVQPHSRVEEVHNNLSVRESDIAVAGSLFAGRECALAGRQQQLEVTRTQLQEREARVSAREAQQAAWEAETAGYSPRLLRAICFDHISVS